MFTFTDGDGRILVLRPEMTTPVARIAATRLREEEVLRLGYMGPVFHYQGAEDTASLKEFDQMGMELMGLSGAGADAEIIALAVEALRESGLTDFFIDLGQVEFFKGLAQEAGLSDAEAEELRRLVEKNDMLAMEMLLISRSSIGPGATAPIPGARRRWITWPPSWRPCGRPGWPTRCASTWAWCRVWATTPGPSSGGSAGNWAPPCSPADGTISWWPSLAGICRPPALPCPPSP